jgi:Ubiquitin-activating enzyme E1 FCCH domain
MQYRTGTINSTTALIASGVNLNLGFVPDVFRTYNTTVLMAGTLTGVGNTYWVKKFPNASAIIETFTAGVTATSKITTNGITPVILGGDWQNTIYTITGITNANPGVVTVSNVQPTNSMLLVNGMTVTISGVVGMTGLNTNRFIVTAISGTTGSQTFALYDTFGHPVNTTALGTYVSGGQLDVISYPPTAPVLDAVTGQVVTPGNPAGLQLDIGFEGLLLGSGVLGSNGDVIFWEALDMTPTGW